MNHDVVYYFGLSLVLVAIIGIIVFLYRLNIIKKTLDLKGILKKYLVFIIGIPLIFLIGFILLNVAFFIDEATINNMNLHNIVLDGGHLTLTYLFGTLFTIFLFTSIYGVYLTYFIPNINEKLKKISKITYISAIVLGVVSFICYTEGIAPYLVYPLANTLHIGEKGIVLLRNPSAKGLNIALYAVFILSGALLVLLICNHLAYKYYGEHGLLYTCFFIAFPCGVIGARLWYVILDISNKGSMSQYVQDWTKIFDIRQGGLGIMGGAILGIIGGVTTMLILKYALKRKPYTKMNYLFVADFIVPAILVAQAIGRWGNFFNNEVNGYPISVEYFAFLPTFIKNQMMYADHGSSSLQPGMIYLPLFFIEFCTNLIGYFVLYYGFGRKYFSKWFIKFTNLFIKDKDKKLINVDSYHADGTLVGGYLVWYGVTRAILEPLRTGSDYFKSSEITSYVMIGGGILIIIFFILFKVLYLDRKPLKEVDVQKDE